jgi:predicted dehydrogenase
MPAVHAAEDNAIRIALIGCGMRGRGAAGNAFDSPGGPVRLVAAADLFEEPLTASCDYLAKEYPKQVDVPRERRFLGFDAYRKAIDCLRPGDLAILTTHCGFRATHLEYAVERGVHVFMEKPFAPDPHGVARLLRAGEAAGKKNLKIAAGLMWRHSAPVQAIVQRLRDGAIGPLQLIRLYRLEPGTALAPFPGGQNELLWQIRHAASFLWASGGVLIEMMLHKIDLCAWLKDAWPTSALGLGGRSANNPDCGQNLDSYSIEYAFADGTKALLSARFIAHCYGEWSTYFHGTKGAARFDGDLLNPVLHGYKDQRIEPDNVAWKLQPRKERVNAWQAEMNALLDAIRADRPHNEVQRAAYSNLAAIMGRAAVHTGQLVTWQAALASTFRFCPEIDLLTERSAAPVRADAQGRYPTPTPGTWVEI